MSVAILGASGGEQRYTGDYLVGAGLAKGTLLACREKGGAAMAVNRFVLNNISYHGVGAIGEIPGEI